MNTDDPEPRSQPSSEADDALGAGQGERFRAEYGLGGLRSNPLQCKVKIEIEFEATNQEELHAKVNKLFSTLLAGGYTTAATGTCTFVSSGKRFTFAELVPPDAGPFRST